MAGLASTTQAVSGGSTVLPVTWITFRSQLCGQTIYPAKLPSGATVGLARQHACVPGRTSGHVLYIFTGPKISSS